MLLVQHGLARECDNQLHSFSKLLISIWKMLIKIHEYRINIHNYNAMCLKIQYKTYIKIKIYSCS